MNAREFLDLQDAYQGVYDEIDEAAVRTPKRVKGAKDTKSYQDDRSQGGMMSSGDSQVSGAGYVRRGGGIQTQTDPNERQPRQGKMDDYTRADMKYRQANLRAGKVHKVGGSKGLPEEVDTFDAILEHLVAEGFADTNEAALAIMTNMSEEWKEEILDEAYQEPKFNRKAYLKKLSKRGGMGMGTPDDPHGYRDPGMAKVGAEFSKRKTAAAKAKKTGEPDEYRIEKEAQSKMR